MCTLTVVPMPDNRLRLAFNRDERRTRPPGLPPTRRWFGTRQAVLPTDPVSGGTWLAVNDAGLVLAILNGTPPPGQEPLQESAATGEGSAKTSLVPPRSRGEIIPLLMESGSPAAVLGALEQAIHYPDFAPFRLVLVGNGVGADVRWDGRQATVMNRLLGDTPLLFTSSGLGDHLVDGVRRELFDELFGGPAAGWADAQDAFHRHRWPGREHLSVNMERASSRTVSHAVIELGDTGACFLYHPDGPAGSVNRRLLHLAFTPAGVP